MVTKIHELKYSFLRWREKVLVVMHCLLVAGSGQVFLCVEGITHRKRREVLEQTVIILLEARNKALSRELGETKSITFKNGQLLK